MTVSRAPEVRRSQRIIRMVCELHRLGYQRLRIMPYFYPLAYRVAIGPAELFSSRNGAYTERLLDDIFALYTSASGNQYFEWEDATGDTARQLADKFIQRFPEVCSTGQGRDWAYAGWLAELMGVMERQEALPFVMEEYYPTPPERLDHLPLWRPDGVTGRFELPPSSAIERDLRDPLLTPPSA